MALELLGLLEAYHNCANMILRILGAKCYDGIVGNFWSWDRKKSLKDYIETSVM